MLKYISHLTRLTSVPDDPASPALHPAMDLSVHRSALSGFCKVRSVAPYTRPSVTFFPSPQDFPSCSPAPLPCSQYFRNFSTGFSLLLLGKCWAFGLCSPGALASFPTLLSPTHSRGSGLMPFAERCAGLISRTLVSTQNRRAAISAFPSDLPSSQSSKC